MNSFPINFPLLLILLGMILGIIIQDNILISFFYGNICLIMSVFFVFISFFYIKQYTKITTFLFAFSFGIFLYNVHYQPNKDNHYTNKIKEHKFYIFEGIIEDVKANRVFISLQKADNQELSGKVVFNLKDTISSEHIGRGILVYSSLKEISSPKNPYQFDYQDYMERQNIYWQGNPLRYSLGESVHFSLVIWAKRLQNQLASKLDNYPFSEESRGIIKALVLGYRSDISKETYQEYVDAGAIHILAISGLHIGIITVLLMKLLDFFFLKRKNKLKILIIFTFLLVYSFVAGLSASVLRAVIMFGAYSVAEIVLHKKARFDSLILSMFLLLMYKPTFLFEVGFQLSYAAVLSILVFLPLYNDYFQYKNIVLNTISSTIKVSIAAQIGIIPISLFYFNQFAGAFLMTNLLILPFLGIILAIGILVVSLSYVNFLPNWLVLIYDNIILTMNWVIEKIASYDAMIFRDVYFDKPMLALSLLIIICLSVWLYAYKNIKLLYTFLISILIFQGYLLFDKYKRQNEEYIIVFHQYGKTILASQDDEKLTYYSDSLSSLPAYYHNFSKNKLVEKIEYKTIPSVMFMNNSYLLVLDEEIYPNFEEKIDYLLLANSPKIHLEKFLQLNKPKKVIIDGSNKSFLVEKWIKTLDKLKISYHNTAEKGFFKI